MRSAHLPTTHSSQVADRSIVIDCLGWIIRRSSGSFHDRNLGSASRDFCSASNLYRLVRRDGCELVRAAEAGEEI